MHFDEFTCVLVENYIEYFDRERREAFAGVRLREVMQLYAFMQASMASWVIVHSRTQLRVLCAGVSTGGVLDERMPKSAIR